MDWLPNIILKLLAQKDEVKIQNECYQLAISCIFVRNTSR